LGYGYAFKGTSLNQWLIAGYCWFQTFSPEKEPKKKIQVPVPKLDPIKNLVLVHSH
jgi:hypothetical protein